MRVSQRLWIVISLATASGIAQGQTESTSEQTPEPRDLLGIAKAEARRERAALTGRVSQLLNELRSSSDENLAFIRKKIDELQAIGPPAVEQLATAMNHSGNESAEVNAGINACRALAGIQGQQAAATLTRLTREGGKCGRQNAVRALGLRGDPSILPVLEKLLSDEDSDLVRLAIDAIGSLGGKDAETLLTGFIDSKDAAFASTAVSGLARLAIAAAGEQVLSRLRAELGTTSPASEVIVACVMFLKACPSPEAIPELQLALEGTTAPLSRRLAAVEALLAVGEQTSGSRKAVLKILKSATQGGLRAVIKSSALAMARLGDDSGVSAVAADLDVEIGQNPKNYNALYKRAELYLEFSKWQRAASDFRDGLRQEKDPRDPDRVYLGLARAYAGMGRYADAAKYLHRMPDARVKSLPEEYEVFREMAADSRHGRVFR